MSRSQRHRILVMNYPADCKITAEHVISPGYMRQQAAGPPFTVPLGPAGGPLQGSSLAGPAPALFPDPRFENPLLAATVAAALIAGSQTPPEPPADAGTTGSRTFPIGPIALASISYNSNDSELVFEMASDPNVTFVEVGDTVRIEATGTTAVNKDYVVTALSDPPGTFWVDGDDPGNGPIVGKGRVTIISGS